MSFEDVLKCGSNLAMSPPCATTSSFFCVVWACAAAGTSSGTAPATPSAAAPLSNSRRVTFMRALLLRRPCGPEVMTRSAWAFDESAIRSRVPGSYPIHRGAAPLRRSSWESRSPPGVWASRSAHRQGRVHRETDMQRMAKIVTSIDVRRAGRRMRDEPRPVTSRGSLVYYLHREEPIEERSIPSKPLSQVLRRHVLAALPPTFEHGPLLGQGFLKPLHHLSYQVLGLFDRSAGLVHESNLDALPP